MKMTGIKQMKNNVIKRDALSKEPPTWIKRDGDCLRCIMALHRCVNSGTMGKLFKHKEGMFFNALFRVNKVYSYNK